MKFDRYLQEAGLVYKQIFRNAIFDIRETEFYEYEFSSFQATETNHRDISLLLFM